MAKFRRHKKPKIKHFYGLGRLKAYKRYRGRKDWTDKGYSSKAKWVQSQADYDPSI